MLLLCPTAQAGVTVLPPVAFVRLDSPPQSLIPLAPRGDAHPSPSRGSLQLIAPSSLIFACCQGVTAPESTDLAEEEEPSLGVAVGITTGRVFCGEAGSDNRREYTLSGARVNLAARLMQAAAKKDAGILVDEDTYHAMANGSCQWEVRLRQPNAIAFASATLLL